MAHDTVAASALRLGLILHRCDQVASSMGAQRGLLLRGGDVLERCAAVDTVVFDKTGTLTEGRLRVQAVLPAGDPTHETCRCFESICLLATSCRGESSCSPQLQASVHHRNSQGCLLQLANTHAKAKA